MVTKKKPEAAKPEAAKPEVKERTVRVIMDLPEHLHREMKVKAAQQGITLKRLIENLFNAK